MLTEQAHYEAGMEEADYMASETDERCPRCGHIMIAWEVEAPEFEGECFDCMDFDRLFAQERRAEFDHENPF